MSITTAVRVGNHIGAGLVSNAKRAVKVALVSSGCIALFVVLGIAALSTYIPYLFTEARDVAELSSNLLLLVNVIHFFDFIQIVFGGIIRGCGQQKFGALVNVVGYNLIGMPLSVALMFATDLAIYGSWTGIGIGIVIECFLFSVVVARTDWDKVTKEALNRTSGKERQMTSNNEDANENGSIKIDDSLTSYSDERLLISTEKAGYSKNATDEEKELKYEPLTWRIIARRIIAISTVARR